MMSHYQVDLFTSLLHQFLGSNEALLTIDGEILAIQADDAVCYGTLTEAALVANKYLHLAEGDIAILNDPYSGGTTLNKLTYVTALSEDLLWVRQKTFQNSLKVGKTLEEEGVRIPPTPLRQKGALNEMILSAIQSHPLLPKNFRAWLEQECADITNRSQVLIETIESIGFTLTPELIEDYFKLCKNTAAQKIIDQVYGEARVDVVLDSGELLRLRLEIVDAKVILDFSGTSAAKTVYLTDAATFGACYAAVSKYYDFADMTNSATLSLIQVVKPSQCWLHGKYPSPILKGMTAGVAAIQNAIALAFSQIHKQKEQSINNHASLWIQIGDDAFELKNGEGACKANIGKNACAALSSIEELERRYPVKVLQYATRPNSGPARKMNGGAGLTLKIQALSDVNAAWLTDLTLHRPRLGANCSLGEVPAITLTAANSEESKALTTVGQITLKAGEVLCFSSGSGGSSGTLISQ
jgi:N-methylhydantoinase B